MTNAGLSLALVSWSFIAADNLAAPLAPSGLRCEYLSDPLGIDVHDPRFSWALNHTARGQKQTAYQLLVATRLDLLAQDRGDQWDSGRVGSEESTQLAYRGKPLESGRACFWKVRYWDKEGNASPYSKPAQFEMGLLRSEDWKGKWIGGGNQLRKEFRLEGEVVRARVYVTALGYYELRINGERVGRNVLDPGWTTYEQRVLYSTYDVTRALHPGANAVGATLGGGWAVEKGPEWAVKAKYVSPAFLMQMNIDLQDGKTLSIVSDASWKTSGGPIVSESIYEGEVYDARLETPGWDRPGFGSSAWVAARVVEGAAGILSTQTMPAIRVVDTIVPLSVWSPRPGVYVYDLGQTIAGWARLRVSGPRGTAVRLRFSELVYGDGTINRENLRRARAQDTYILRGEGKETYEPHFTYHGFRYVEVTGYPGTPSLDSLRGRVVHSAVETVGSFAGSNILLNQIQRSLRWTQLNNLHSVPTDCPQRDERMGWMGDAQLSAEEAMMNFDMAAFYTNFIRDIRDVQDPDGSITDTVPFRGGRRPADPAWGSAYPVLCWTMWEQYGDRRILEEDYEGLRRYVEFLRGRASDHVLTYSYYGDWIATAPTPGEYVSAAYYYYNVRILSKIAAVLEKPQDAQSYTRLAEEIKEAFNRKYFDAASSNYANGTQAANAMALFLGLVPQGRRGDVLGKLTDDIVYRHDTHLTTGIHGTKYLMLALTEMGRSDLAYELATQTTYPSWGYMIAHGATTVWELWQYKVGPAMNSHQHPALGSVGAWFYKALAGINADSERPGYRYIHFSPQIPRDLGWASASIETSRGTVACSWTRQDDAITVRASIPVGSEGEIRIPKAGLSDVVVKEGDQVVWQEGSFRPGVRGLQGAREDADSVAIDAGSGDYSFLLASR